MTVNATPGDRLSIGRWTVEWVGQDQLGGASRSPLSSHPVFTAGGFTSKALKLALAAKVTP